MLITSETMYWLVICVFVCQLISISVLVSFQWRNSRKLLLQQYPETTFPNLYVNPAALEFRRLEIRKWLDIVTLIIGCAVLLLSTALSADIQQLATNMIYVAILQLIPISISAFWCISNNQMMGKKFPSKVRKVAISGEPPFALLPKIKLGLALLLTAAAYFVGSLVGAELTSVEEVSKTTQLQLLNGLVFVVIMALVITSLLGAKSDNFAEPQETRDKQQAKLRYLLNGLIAFNLFILAIYLAKYFALNNLSIMLVASIFVQILIFTTKNQYLPINPAAYKAGR